MKSIFFLLAACFSVAVPAMAADCPAPGSAVELFGTIGKGLGISMTLSVQQDRLSGSYMYVKYEKKISLSGTCAGGTVALQESNASGKPTGSFRGTLTQPQFVEGTWSSADGKKTLPFRLQALSPTDVVSGSYKMGNYAGEKKSRIGAELDILLREDGTLRVQGNAIWVNPASPSGAHDGAVNGTAKLTGGQAVYIDSPDDPDSCRFTMHFSNRTVTVSDDNLKCGGINVTFEGTYQRVGPPAFDDSLN